MPGASSKAGAGNLRHWRESVLVMRSLLVLLVIATSAVAQPRPQLLIDSSTPAIKTADALPDAPSCLQAPVAQQRFSRAIESQREPVKTIDKQFLILNAVAVAATVADIETAAACLNSNARCQETNPLFGKHPSRARMYSIALGATGGEILLAAVYRSRYRRSALWRLFPAAAIAAHSYGIGVNVSNLRR